MPNVIDTSVKDWTKDDGTVVKVCTVKFDDGTEAPGYDLPRLLEIGKPLPEGWEVATSKAGKPYIKVPRPGRGGGGGQPAAFRNTKEGQAYEQERMDRRTALMQAVEHSPGETGLFSLADEMYDWLRKTAGGVVHGEGAASPATTSTPAVKPTGEKPGMDDQGPVQHDGGGGPHVHTLERIPNVTKFQRCTECGETVKT